MKACTSRPIPNQELLGIPGHDGGQGLLEGALVLARPRRLLTSFGFLQYNIKELFIFKGRYIFPAVRRTQPITIEGKNKDMA